MENHITVNNGIAELKINPKIYPIEVIYSAAYIFLDRAYIILDGNPKEEVIVKIKPKHDDNPEIMGSEFYNELINYADYQKRAERTIPSRCKTNRPQNKQHDRTRRV